MLFRLGTKVITKNHAAIAAAATVAIGVASTQVKYIKPAYTGYRFLKRQYPETYNPLEQSAYTGNKTSYDEDIKDIHDFNQIRPHSYLLRRNFPEPINIKQQFRINNIAKNIQDGKLVHVIDAQADDLVVVFYDNLGDAIPYNEHTQKVMDAMYQRSYVTKYNQFLWAHTGYQLKLNNALLHKN
jgi:hypothetical protein